MLDWSIIVGINHYVSPSDYGLKPLNGAIRDAICIAKWLLKHGNVPRKNIKLIISNKNLQPVIKNDVDKEIAAVVKEIITGPGSANRLYFYFAGHGIGVDNDIENNGLCLSNWDHYIYDAATLSSSDYKRKFLSQGLFKEVIMWLDCCRNVEQRLTPGASSGFKYQGINLNPRYFVAKATTYDNQSFEAAQTIDGHKEWRGIFTKVLLDGLNGAAKNSKGDIDAVSLSNYLYKNVSPEASKEGYSQEPDISHNASPENPINF